jgi:hypothetical protein
MSWQAYEAFGQSVVYVGKTRSLPKRGAPERCSAYIALSYNLYATLERPVRHRHSTLFGTVMKTKKIVNRPPPGLVCNASFYTKLTIGPNKLECFSLTGLCGIL